MLTYQIGYLQFYRATEGLKKCVFFFCISIKQQISKQVIFSADLHLHLHFVLCLFTLTETLWEIAKQTIGRSNKPFSIILNRYFMQWEFVFFLFLTFILLVCGRTRDGAYNAFECDRPNERTTIHGIWFMNQFQTIFHNEKNESNNLSEFPLTFFQLHRKQAKNKTMWNRNCTWACLMATCCQSWLPLHSKHCPNAMEYGGICVYEY